MNAPRTWTVYTLAASLLCSGCSEDETCETSHSQPISLDQPEALFVTSELLRESFERYVALHDVTGTTSGLITVEEICEAATCDDSDPRSDTARAIKDYLSSRADHLRYVVLGGDIEILPSRMVHDSYSDELDGSSYEEDFYTDYYYSDLSEWDGNGDGIYAEDGVDSPDYQPEISVSRIPVSSSEEAERYLLKVIRHLTAFRQEHVKKSLLMSNVATNYMGFEIDGAVYYETEGRTCSLLPEDFAQQKLYANTALDPTAEQLTLESEEAGIEAGQNLVIHNGHGSTSLLSVEVSGNENAFSGEMAYGLVNETYPILLSCACQAGDFSVDDSAGEMLLNAPEGGAIAYLGNTAIGLGLAGGMQLIDELLRHVQQEAEPVLGDAYLVAHQSLPEEDDFTIGAYSIPVIDEESYQWTQKAVVLMGDHLIPIYREPLAEAPVIALSSREPACDGSGTSFTFSISPADLVGTFRLQAGDYLYEVPDAGGSVTVTVSSGDGSAMTAGFESGSTYPGYLTIAGD